MAVIKPSKIAIFLVVFLSWSTVFADTCRPLEPDYYGIYKFNFPKDLSGIRLVKNWTDDDPQIGTNALYQGQGVTINVAIADYGVSGIPDGANSPVVQRKFEEIKAELKSGPYDRVLLQSERQRSIGQGAIPVIEAMHTLEAGGTRTMSFNYLGAKYGKFVKLDLALSASRSGDANKITDAILASAMGILCQNTVSQNGSGSNLSVSADDKKKALAAIDRMLRAPSVNDAMREVQDVTNFAMSATGAVMVHVTESFFEPSGDQYVDAFLMAYFLAGAVKFDLENPDLALHRSADIPSAIRAMVYGYNLYTIENAYFNHAFVEGFAQIDASGGLEDYVNSLQ